MLATLTQGLPWLAIGALFLGGAAWLGSAAFRPSNARRPIGGFLMLLSLIALVLGAYIVYFGVYAASCAPDAYECPV
jgi:hypothetical protein